MATTTHNAKSYYPIGNTRSVDVTLGCQVDKECEVLLLGCGDVRNVLHTIHELRTRGTTKAKDQTINIHLNDTEDSILGRDLILLYLAGTIDPNNWEDLKFLWGVWYDVLLSQEHLQRLKQVMKEVALVQSGNNGVYFGNLKSEVSIKGALLGMEKTETNGKQITDKRWEFLNCLYREEMTELTIDWTTRQLVSAKVDLPQTAVEWITQKISAQCGRLDKVQRLKDRYHQEIRDYITTGVTRVNLQSLSSKRVVDSFSGNMTLLKPGCNTWAVSDDCCPYLSHDIDLELHRYDGCKVTLASLCMEMLKKWVESFQAAMKDGCVLKIYMWLGEATEVCEMDLPESLRFDFIDTSNLADKIGLVSVLSCSRDRLKQPNGVLRTESFDYTKLEGFVSVERYLYGYIDVPLLMYPTVFGLHLAEELSLGHESVPPTQFPIRTKLTLKWKTAREQKHLTAVTLDEKASDAVSAALEKVKTCPGLDKRAAEKIQKRVQNIAKATTKSNTLIEYTDHYLVTIQTDPECLKKGIFSMDCVDGDPYVIVLQNSHNGQSSFRETLSLSCGIALNVSSVKFSRKRGKIEARLVKDADVTLGERVLPWNKLNTSSVADLPNFPLSESGKETIETYVGSMCLLPLASLSHHMSPKEQLRFLMELILIKAPFSFGLPTLITIRAESVTNPDKSANNMLRLEDLKIHEKRPTLFLTFFDFDKADNLVSQKKITDEEILPWQQTKKTCVELDPSSSPHLSKGYALLVKLLEVNSIRMIQYQPEDRRWMTRTILRGRYAFKFEEDLAEMFSSLLFWRRKDMSERVRFSQHDLYYPVGNTRSLDITHGCEVAEECDMLFLGCGDIRNVLHTIHVLQRDGTTKSEGQIINIHLNDVENGVLSRDLILLYLVRTIDPANDEDMRFMWGIWYDCLLSQDHSQRLQHVLKQLSTLPISSFDVYFGNLQTESSTRNTLRSWMNAEINGKLTSGKREAFIRIMYQDHFPEPAVQRIASRLTRMCDHLMSTPRLKDRLYQEIREFVVTGVSRVNSAPLSSERVIERFCGNMTFFRPGYEHMWKVEDNCCPLLCYNVDLQLDRYDGKHVTMSSLCLAILKQWVESYQAAIKEGCIIKVHLWQGEATVLCETGLPENLHFDFIDTSNIGDWLGLIPVLIYCKDRLKRPDGIVGTQIFHWHQRASSVTEFLQSCFDIPVLMYPTVFGFHLAEELSLGHESFPDSGSYVGVGMIYLIWKVGREERELTELTILQDGTDAVSDALHKLLKPCMVGDGTGPIIAKPSAFDAETRENVMTRIKGISKTMEKSTVDVQSTNTQTPSSKQRTIVEYIDHYRVTITTDPECLKEGKFTVEHARGDPNLVVLINTQRGKPSFRKLLRVSCGISINSSKITLSRKSGTVDARLVKDVKTTVGEGVLPWKKVELDSVSDLPDFPPSKYGESIIDNYITQVWPFEPTDTVETQNAVEQLKWLLWYLFKTMRQSFGVPQLLRLGVSNLAIPSQRANNRFHLKGLKVHENMPTLFLEFFDFDKAEELVKQQKLTTSELAPFYVRLGDYREMDAAFCANLRQGYDLLVKILELNSHRIIQHQSENKRWILRTYLRGRYPFQGRPEPVRPDNCQLM